MKTQLPLVVAVALGVQALAVLSALRMYVGYAAWGPSIPWTDALLTGLLDWSLWSLFLPVVVVAARRWPLVRSRLGWRIGGHAALSIAVSAAQLALFAGATVLVRGAGPEGLLGELRSGFSFKFHSGVAVYWAACLGLAALDARARQRREELRRVELEGDLVRARLRGLQSSLRPHFLFNTLNAISTLVRSDAAVAERLIARLSELLRHSMDAEEEPFVTLAEERELVEAYVAIQRARFGARVEVELNFDDEALDADVPPFLLQPIVENAFRHGIEARLGTGRVGVRVRTAGERIEALVEDDGAGEPQPDTGGRGRGLAHVRARLALLYGSHASLELTARENGGTHVRILLPREAPEPRGREDAA